MDTSDSRNEAAAPHKPKPKLVNVSSTRTLDTSSPLPTGRHTPTATDARKEIQIGVEYDSTLTMLSGLSLVGDSIPEPDVKILGCDEFSKSDGDIGREMLVPLEKMDKIISIDSDGKKKFEQSNKINIYIFFLN